MTNWSISKNPFQASGEGCEGHLIAHYVLILRGEEIVLRGGEVQSAIGQVRTAIKELHRFLKARHRALI